jgi:hypothetical protein
MSRDWKIGQRAIGRGAFVEVEQGERLARVIRQKIKYHQQGYDVMPLRRDAGDSQGVYTIFVPDRFAKRADMSKWVPSDDGRFYSRKIDKEKKDHENSGQQPGSALQDQGDAGVPDDVRS